MQINRKTRQLIVDIITRLNNIGSDYERVRSPCQELQSAIQRHSPDLLHKFGLNICHPKKCSDNA